MFTRLRFPIALAVAAWAMTLLFWWPMFGGAGLIGGDIYPYFLPQKAFYADRLKLGEFPLWNDLSGFGYPVLGESQTGAAYPFHLVCYRLFDLNTAYNLEHLLHYVLCFVATGLFAKRLGLSGAGAGLAALVFTYGWFPPRACLEWAILTGAWLPVALWCVESFLQTRWWRYAIGLSIALGLQLLAGHYHLAFITQLVVATYGLTRVGIWRPSPAVAAAAAARDPVRGDKRLMVGLALAGLAGISLAAVQVLPTWELKQRSSRVVTGGDYDPAYGHMPPLYVTQLIAPWCWYSPQAIQEDHLVRDLAEFAAPWHWFGPDQNLDLAIQRHRWGGLTNGTNQVEAHVYCGLVPVLMGLMAILVWFRHQRKLSTSAQVPSVMERMTGYWLLAGLLALIYATGWLLPIGRLLPGFSFFRGPGRYGIVTTLSIALLAGQCLSQLFRQQSSRFVRMLVLALVFGSTCGDLWLVSRMVKYSELISRPAISYRNQSEVRRLLQGEGVLPRLLAPGPNVANLLGVSCVPWYLGIAPAEYVDPQFAMPPLPQPSSPGKPAECSPELRRWLSQSGVTHVLNFEPLEETSWQVELLWRGVDPFLNRVWGRREPILLYRFRTTPLVGESLAAESVVFPGRAYLGGGDGLQPQLDPIRQTSESRQIRVDEDSAGDRVLTLTELAYPGWHVTRNGVPWESGSSGLFRSVTCPGEGGDFVWTYRPSSVLYGAVISLMTLILLATIGHIRFWHPHLTRWLDRSTEVSIDR